MTPQIIGAGLSGLIAAHVLDDAEVVERNTRGQMHNAVLRFRSDVVSDVTGIPFKKVIVRKGIFMHGLYIEPNIQICNAYTYKVLNTTDGDRSIWNQDPVERWIAPPDFYDRMVERLSKQNRIWFGQDVELASCAPGTVSTAPLPLLMSSLGIENPGIEFDYQPIYTFKHKLEGFKNVYQTVYFPSMHYGLYRASVTDDTLIAEFVSNVDDSWSQMAEAPTWMEDLVDAFGIDPSYTMVIRNRMVDAEMKEGIVRTQKYGKIVPIDKATRMALLLYITAKHGIYSLGRFATWRNILLDDVVKDAHSIKSMMHMDDYTSKIQRSKHASHTD